MRYFLCYDNVALCWVVYEYNNGCFIVLNISDDLFDAINYYKCLLDIG